MAKVNKIYILGLFDLNLEWSLFSSSVKIVEYVSRVIISYFIEKVFVIYNG